MARCASHMCILNTLEIDKVRVVSDTNNNCEAYCKHKQLDNYYL